MPIRGIDIFPLAQFLYTCILQVCYTCIFPADAADRHVQPKGVWMAVVTTTDLAKKLGLTRVTISRAINNDRRVSPKTRQRVLQAMEEHCLQPNAFAQALVRGRTNTIGFSIGTNLGGDYAQELMVGLESSLDIEQYSILIGVSQFSAKRERSELSAMVARRVEGIISQPLVENRDYYQRLLQLDMPMVFIADYIDLPGAAWVVSDVVHDVTKLMQHLLALRHRRIAYVGPKSPSMQIIPRLKTYRKIMGQVNAPVRPTDVFEGVEGGKDDVYAAVHQMMQQPNPPTAFFATVDIIGMYVMDQLRRDGYRVPQDVSVIGMGDISTSKYDMISLSTISEDRFEMGRRAGEIMLQRITEPNTPPQRVLLPGKLIQRNSTGPVSH